jgi:hypothetical protein
MAQAVDRVAGDAGLDADGNADKSEGRDRAMT